MGGGDLCLLLLNPGLLGLIAYGRSHHVTFETRALVHGYIWPWSLEFLCKKTDSSKATMLERSCVGTQGTVPAEPSLPAIFANAADMQKSHPGPCPSVGLPAEHHCVTSISAMWYQKNYLAEACLNSCPTKL